MRRTNIPDFRVLLALLSLAVAPGFFPDPADAQAVATPSLMNFQGRLARPDGTPVVNGNYSIQFSLFTALTGGTKLWEQTINPVVVRNGTFAAQLNVGANFLNGATAATLFNTNLWLEIKIGTDAALTPRQQLVSVAYAQKAGTVPDGSLTASKFASGALNNLSWLLGGNSATNPASQFLGTTDNQPLVFRTNNAERMRLLADGKLGIGTNAPVSKLDVSGTDAIGFRYRRTDARDARIQVGDPTKSWSLASGWATAGDFSIIEEGTSGNRLYIQQTTGNVGIGTSTPAARLDVNGTAQMTGFKLSTGAAAGRALISDASGTGTWQVPPSSGPTGPAGGDLTGSYPNPELRTLTSSLFKVSGTLMSALQGGSGGIDVAQNTVTAQNQDEAWQSFTPTASGSLTAIDVYIGTTTGQNKTIPLTIYSGEGTTGGVLRQVSIIVTPTMGFQNFTVSPPVALTGGQKYTFYIGRSSSLQFGYSDNNPYAGGVADLNGGIDYAFRTYMNTGAGGRVNVNGDFTTSGFLGISNNNVLELGFGVSGKEANAGKIGYQTFTPDALDIIGAGTSNSNRKIKFWSEGGVTFAGGITGNLGIGTNSPAAKLHLQDGAFRIGNTTDNKNYELAYDSAGDYFYIDEFGSTRHLVIKNGGNVGIGTTAPAAKLDVNGAANIAGALTSGPIMANGSVTSGSLTTGAITAGPIISGPIASGAITAGGAVTHGNVVSLGNIAANGAIGTAAATVDVTSTILINQTTTFRSLTLPNPTMNTAGRMVRIVNTGTAKFQVQQAALIPPGRAMTFLWMGSAWIPDTNLKRVLTGTVTVGNIGSGNTGALTVTGDFLSASSQGINDTSNLVTVTLGWTIPSYTVHVTVGNFDTSTPTALFSETSNINPPTVGTLQSNSFQIWWQEQSFGQTQKVLAHIMVIER